MGTNRHVIIVAGGVGKRMNSETPKQFLELNKKPVLMHTIQAFFDFDVQLNIWVVLPESQTRQWQKLCETYNFNINHTLVSGGTERFHSVKNGLSQIKGKGIVAIHDGVRPLVNKTTIISCFTVAEKKGNAIPIVPINESLRRVTKHGSDAVNRSDYVTVQTPQCFDISQLKAAYTQNFSSKFTDDASVIEATGATINLVDGNIENIKITTPQDLQLASILLVNKK